MIRRLDPERDENLIREALAWINEQPQFYRDAERAWGKGGLEEYLELMRGPQIDFGVFDGEQMIAVITASLVGKKTFESHLMVKRGSNVRLIIEAAKLVLSQMIGQGLVKEAWCWLASKNHGVRKVLESIGMMRDGVELFKGQSHGQPIHWLRYSIAV